MLKSKKSLYFLLPGVALIWGLLIWKIIGSFSDKAPVSPPVQVYEKKPVQIKKKDTFSLIKLEQDPFLGTAYIKPAAVQKKAKNVTTLIEWPPINYLGLVSDTKIASQIHILKINNIQYLLRPGEEAEGVKLIRAKQEKVIMGYKGNQKEFLKSISY